MATELRLAKSIINNLINTDDVFIVIEPSPDGNQDNRVLGISPNYQLA